MRKLVLSFLFSTLALWLFAQNEILSGYVVDVSNDEVLAFTSLSVEGSSRGGVANSEGAYIINISGLSELDHIVFSHVGYEVGKYSISYLRKHQVVKLKAAQINLKEVEVSSRDLTVKEILALVRKNYNDNHPKPAQKSRIFYHKYEKVPFSARDGMKVKHSDFVGLDKETFESLLNSMPEEFIDYRDAMIDLYQQGEGMKIEVVEAISLEEGSNEALFAEMEEKLEDFFEDVQEARRDEDVYFKVRSGIISKKLKNNEANDSIHEAYKEDKNTYALETNELQDEIKLIHKDYSTLDGDNWEFISKPGKYRYTIEKITLYNNEVVYEISFQAKKGGLYQGEMYINTSNFAILQLNFEYAEGKSNEKFQVLGIGHEMRFKKGRVIFERIDDAYFVKYIYAQQHEWASIDRDFSIMKKKKRFLIDKELNEMKMSMDLDFDANAYWEILFMEREEISSQEYEDFKPKVITKFKREFAYSPEMWSSGTGIKPTSELQEYKRK